MPSLQARLIRTFSRRVIRREGLDGPQLVRHLRRVFNRPPPISFLPRGTAVSQINRSGFCGEHIARRRGRQQGPVILYVHGGAYIAGTTRTYHGLAGRLAKYLDAQVYLVQYPFAPENPFPSAVEKVIEAYQFLLGEGHAPENLVVAGDSAGGGLSLALMLALKDRGLPLPAGAALFSPGGSCTLGSYVYSNSDSDVMLSADMIQRVVEVYVQDPSQYEHRYASPAHADLSGLPPLLITAERSECLYGDALDIRWRAEEAGIELTWIEREGLFHVWPIMVPFLPEARQDLKQVVAFIRQCVGDAVSSADAGEAGLA